MILNNPYILEETNDFAVVFKPPKMHSEPLKQKKGGTLFDWYAEQFPSVFNIMHRLDFETHGLVLFAKNEKSFIFFKQSQEEGNFIKEYSAICKNTLGDNSNIADSSFPPSPAFTNFEATQEKPLIINSYFRPFGEGRKLVRPLINDKTKFHEVAKDNGGFYRTNIISINDNIFTVQIKRGFRHQIRCHLCWIGCPILNDPLYGAGDEFTEENLALRAHGLFFEDPSSGKQLEFRVEGIGA